MVDPEDRTESLELVIRSSLESLHLQVSQEGWTGRREKEMVSYFCFGHLLDRCRPGSFLYDPRQIGIEVAVPQIAGQTVLSGKESQKPQVCKDIVFWPEPGRTCWDPNGRATVYPSSIIEWKHNVSAKSDYDKQWLIQFSQAAPGFVGYRVTTELKDGPFELCCDRVQDGEVQEGWLKLPREE